jgi:hypothetical protein
MLARREEDAARSLAEQTKSLQQQEAELRAEPQQLRHNMELAQVHRRCKTNVDVPCCSSHKGPCHVQLCLKQLQTASAA